MNRANRPFLLARLSATPTVNAMLLAMRMPPSLLQSLRRYKGGSMDMCVGYVLSSALVVTCSIFYTSRYYYILYAHNIYMHADIQTADTISPHFMYIITTEIFTSLNTNMRKSSSY